MQRIKLLGLAIFVMLALSAVVSATAFGTEISFLSKAKTPILNLRFSGTSKKETKFTILNGFAQTKCPEVATEAVQEGTGLLGTFHLHWKGCTTNLGGTCIGLNDTAEPGTILALGTFHLVYDKLGSGAELGVAMLLLFEHVHYTCEGGFVPKTLVLVLGEVLCLVKPVNALTSTLTIVCEGTSGDPVETTYWKSNNGEEVKMGTNTLLGSQNEGALEMSAESGEVVSTASEEFEIMG